jgi:flotillin
MGDFTIVEKLQGTALLCGAGVLGLMLARFRVAKPDQFLVRTGIGIKDMLVSKKGIQFPFQKAQFVNMKPITHEFNLHNMSKEKVEFSLPVVVTLGPISPYEDGDSFKNYARRMTGMEELEIRETISGMVEGETRGLTAKMTIEEMFAGKDIFKEKVVDKIDNDLRKLGLKIYNANIKEMADFDANNKYFEYRKKRAIETANYEAQVEVSKAKRDGDIGVARNVGDTRVATAEIERDATLKENEREKIILKSNAEVKEVEAEAHRVTEVSRIEADMAAQTRENELLKEVEQRRAEQMLEAERANLMSVAISQAEAMERKADAHLYQKDREAQGIYKVLKAKADGLAEIREAAQSDHLAQFYYGVDTGLYQELAKEASNAVKGMEPKVHLWKTGSDAFDKNTLEPITKMMQNFAPALEGINDHVKLPDWIPSAHPDPSTK